MAELDIDDIQRRMDASIASLHNEFMGLRAGRASTGMLEPIMVDAYGSKMPMNQVGNILAKDTRFEKVGSVRDFFRGARYSVCIWSLSGRYLGDSGPTKATA